MAAHFAYLKRFPPVNGVHLDIFYAARLLCRLDRLDYAHFRRWKLYGEEVLAQHPAVIWLPGEALTIEHAGTPLAKYAVDYQPDKKHFRDVPTAERLITPYCSLQGQLWELDDKLWKLATKRPDYAPRNGDQGRQGSGKPPLSAGGGSVSSHRDFSQSKRQILTIMMPYTTSVLITTLMSSVSGHDSTAPRNDSVTVWSYAFHRDTA